MINTTHYDVGVIGSGPFGGLVACLGKALVQSKEFCMLDKRLEPTRTHGLAIKADSILKVEQLINKYLVIESPNVHKGHLESIKAIVSAWKDNVVSTAQIENTLIQKAHEMGIKVLKGKEYEIKPGDLTVVLDQKQQVDPRQKILRDLLGPTEIIIAADGAHSVATNEFQGDKMVEKRVLQHIIELKYKTDGKAVPRTVLEASKYDSKSGHISFEFMNHKIIEGTKPGTLHVMVDQGTYESFREKDAEGKLKGVFGNSWILEEIHERSKHSHKVKEIYDFYLKYIQNLKSRGGSFGEEKISSLEMAIGRREYAVVEYENHLIVSGGDAYSWMVSQRGCNKAFMEAAACAEAMSEFYSKDKPINHKIPKEFLHYQDRVARIYANERSAAEFKNIGINVMQTSYGITAKSYQTSELMVESTTNSSSMLLDTSKYLVDKSNIKEVNLVKGVLKRMDKCAIL